MKQGKGNGESDVVESLSCLKYPPPFVFKLGLLHPRFGQVRDDKSRTKNPCGRFGFHTGVLVVNFATLCRRPRVVLDVNDGLVPLSKSQIGRFALWALSKSSNLAFSSS